MLEAAHKLLAAELECGWIHFQKMRAGTQQQRQLQVGDTAGQLRLL